MKDQIAFILSSNHSGSTWLGYVLGSHSTCAFLGEYWRAWAGPQFRQPCALCTAQGKHSCDVLHGIEHVQEYNAFRFAFSRFKTHTLIDISKSVAWAERFASHRSEYQISIIHLIRDPRGYYSSKKRRHSRPPELLQSVPKLWVDENDRIRNFIQSTRLRSTTISYDELAEDPLVRFPWIFTFLNLQFEKQALSYWTRDHHGFAANGASSFILDGFPHTPHLDFHKTEDDAYYQARRRRFFRDTRWTDELTEEETTMIMEHAEVRDFLNRSGYTMNMTGLSRTDEIAS